MREKIMELLQKEECSYKILKGKIRLGSQEDLKELLHSMELNGEIYQTEENTYTLFPENFKIGKIQFTKSKNPYIVYEDNTMQYLDENNLNGALNYDTVIIDKESLKIIKILARECTQVVCEVNIENGIKYLKPYHTGGNWNIRIDNQHMKQLQEGDRIIVKVSLEKTEEYFEGTFLEKIGNIKEPDVELKSIAISNGFQTEFNEECLKQVKTIPQTVLEEEIKGRLDLRNQEIFTIDGAKTKDMDDAVSIQKLENDHYILGVHIADVSHYIQKDTPLFEEAKDRGTSLYMADSVIPMLPSEISNGICSLNPHTDRLTISCIMEIDQNGEIIDYQIHESVINSKMKMTYEDVNKTLAKDLPTPSEYEPFQKSLLLMQQLSQILTEKKEQRGYLRFANTEINLIENENGKITEIQKSEKGQAEEMIENFMVMANTCIATHLGWIEFIPSIYRNHGNPNFDKVHTTIDFISDLGYRIQTIKNTNNALVLQKILKQLSNNQEFPILSTLILKSMQRAEYNTKNKGHFALELPFYTHFTSPIRRFPDLAVHLILKKHTSLDLEFTDFQKMEQTLQKICTHSSRKERQADLAEEEAVKLKIVEYMRDHQGEFYYGFIKDINASEIQVQTVEGIPGIVKTSSLAPSCQYNQEKRYIVKDKKRPILKVGHSVLLKVEDICLEKRMTIFHIEQNLTLAKKNQTEKRLVKQL